MRVILIILLSICSFNLPAEDLYTFLRPSLEMFPGPFTVFDFDSENTDVILQIAENFPLSTCIIAGTKPELLEKALDTCKSKPLLTNVMILSAPLNIADLKNLAATEHFDITLLGNPQPSKSLLFITKILSTKVVTPTLTLINGNKNIKIKSHWFSSKKPHIPINISEKGQHITISPPDSNWSYEVLRSPGLSLITFLALQGSWPDKATLEKKISEICWHPYDKFTPWDISIAGSQIEIPPFTLSPGLLQPLKPLILELFFANSLQELKTTIQLQEMAKIPK